MYNRTSAENNEAPQNYANNTLVLLIGAKSAEEEYKYLSCISTRGEFCEGGQIHPQKLSDEAIGGIINLSIFIGNNNLKLENLWL